MNTPAAESLSLTHPEDAALTEGDAVVLAIVARWHNETHPGAFATCDQQPCDAVQRVMM